MKQIMADTELYNDLIPVSNEWLRRNQVPTDREIDRTSFNLIKFFVNTVDPNMERLPGLGSETLDEANRFLTVELKNIGINLGSHPSREIERANKIFDYIKDNPQVTYTINKNGVKEHHSVPLLKDIHLFSDGTCKLLFNDALRYFFFPEKNYSLCSFTLLEEIRQRNVYASIIFEEACSYEYMFRIGKKPFFSWSMKDARVKFSFDRMKNFSKDRTSYETETIKTMRPNNMMSRIINPALAVLEELFNEGKIRFWLELETVVFLERKGAGRPPKDLFHFYFRNDKKVPMLDAPVEGEQLDIFGYEEMNTLYYIREELKKILRSRQMIKKITDQLLNNEQIGSHEDVLATIKNMRSNYGDRPKNERANLILTVLGREHHLGDPSKYGKPNKEEGRFWPDDIEGRIKVMMNSPEIKDRAAREHGLSSQEVDTLLQGDFFQICVKNSKLKKDWNDAVDYFFNWLKRLGIRGPLENVTYGNNKQRKSNYGRATTSNYGQTAAIILNECID